MSKQEKILKDRAEKLATVIDKQISDSDSVECLVFKLAQEKYAIETKYIKEVYPYKDYTPLPCVPPFIFGLVNIRRKILSILDLKVFFSLKGEESSNKKFVILENAKMELALLTDGIEEIHKISMHDIQASLSSLIEEKQKFLKGITPHRIAILDAEKLLDSKEIIVNETVEQN